MDRAYIALFDGVKTFYRVQAFNNVQFTHEGQLWKLTGTSGGAVYLRPQETAAASGTTVTLQRVTVTPETSHTTDSTDLQLATPWNTFRGADVHPMDKSFIDSFATETMSNSYYSGKRLAMYANLLYFVDSTASVDTLGKQLLRYCSYTVHDPIWGGHLPSISGRFHTHTYNDLHFHYGYAVYAAAIYVQKQKVDKPLKEFKRAIEPLLYTMMYQCPPGERTNPLWYQYVKHDGSFEPRYMSLVHGHSWAHGLTPMANGTQQESTSEAVNAWYAVYLYGTATDDLALINIGKKWCHLEIESAKYRTDVFANDWIPDSTNVNKFDGINSELQWMKPDVRYNPIVAIRAQLSLTKSTWFSEYAWSRHMIQILPVTPITQSLHNNNERYNAVYEAINKAAFPTTSDETVGWKDSNDTPKTWVASLVKTASMLRIMLSDTRRTTLKLEGYTVSSGVVFIDDTSTIASVDNYKVDEVNNNEVYVALDDGLSYSVAEWFRNRHSSASS